MVLRNCIPVLLSTCWSKNEKPKLSYLLSQAINHGQLLNDWNSVFISVINKRGSKMFI